MEHTFADHKQGLSVNTPDWVPRSANSGQNIHGQLIKVVVLELLL
jgi:hypothetical protein